jgi:hypothetical protein
MKRALKFAIMAGIFIALSASSAKADGTFTYTLTQEGSSTPLATWEMPSSPIPSCSFTPCSQDGDFFAFTTEVSIDGGAPVTDTLIFLNTSMGTDDLNDMNLLIPEVTGLQLYSGPESNPTMIFPVSGFFTVVGDLGDTDGTEYILSVSSVSQTPEPATLLLLGSGLVAFGMRKRRATR